MLEALLIRSAFIKLFHACSGLETATPVLLLVTSADRLGLTGRCTHMGLFPLQAVPVHRMVSGPSSMNPGLHSYLDTMSFTSASFVKVTC